MVFDACWCLWSSAMAGRTEGQVQHKGKGRHWPGCRVHKRVTCQSQAPALLSWMNMNKMSRPCLLNCKTASVVNSKKAWFTLPQILSSYSGPPIFRLLFLNSSKQQKWHPLERGGDIELPCPTHSEGGGAGVGVRWTPEPGI